ncbi:pentapeptide repeat-containing protein [Streptomyces cyaneus]|uniref:pentapeptide repeat-containing protein n=1 Tax=Streptomyces cyaneus TaxID=1904 RepID=UPI000FF88078|nr:pentapeptide repeat-containing protein [Streptomyces cyaneus]
MWEAYRVGEWCENVAEVRGGTLRHLLIAAPSPHPGCQARLRLRGAHVTGELDLAEVTVAGSVRLDRCRFDDAVRLDNAHLEAALALNACTMPGLSLVGARITLECEITACTVTGTVDLRSLTVGNRLSLNDTAVHPSHGEAALDAQSIEVGEDFWASGLDCAGTVFLNNARIQDVLAFRGSRITGDSGLQAPELTVGGGLFLDSGFSGTGQINLYGASIGGSVRLDDCRLDGPGAGPGAYALNLSCAEIGGDIWAGRGLVVQGPAIVRDTSVRGSVVLRGARFDISSGVPTAEAALDASRLRVGGDIDCRDGFTAHGMIDLRDSRIGGSVLFEGAELTALDNRHPALRGNGVETGGVFNLCDGFTAHGRISLISVTVRSRACFDDAVLAAPADEWAVSFIGSSATILSLHLREAPAGVIDLRQSRIGLLEDAPAAWPTGLVLDGAVYDNLHPALPARARLPWLSRDPAGLVPQPYEQLAATYQRQGQDADARAVLVAKHRSMRRTLSPPARLWSLLQDATVGYGYRPLRAVWLLLCLLTTGTALFSAWPPMAVGDGKVPPFQPAIYTLDLLLPLVDLGQERSYAPTDFAQWAAVVLVGMGWLLATTVAAGASRVLRRA